MKKLLYLVDCLIPILIIYVVFKGLKMKLPVFELFIEGAKEGLKTVVKLFPTLIGLLIAVGVLRASGILTLPIFKYLGWIPEIWSLIFVKLFSSSAATGFMLDIFETYGVDSYYGTLAALILSCTESSIYTMSVYYMSQQIEKTRWTLLGALFSAFAGIMACIWILR